MIHSANRFFQTQPLQPYGKPHPASHHGKRNSFQELFERDLAADAGANAFGAQGRAQAASHALPAAAAASTPARLRQAPAPPASVAVAAPPASAAEAAPGPPFGAPVVLGVNENPLGVDLAGYEPIDKPLALDPLKQAMQNAGLPLDKFSFDEVQSLEIFPTRPDLSFINRQLLITGPGGAKLFDLNLALRTPWVTAVELQTDGIA